jgi:hypothetical protein
MAKMKFKEQRHMKYENFNLMLMNLKMFVLVFIGITSVFLPVSCQGGDMIWSAWWRRKQKTS